MRTDVVVWSEPRVVDGLRLSGGREPFRVEHLAAQCAVARELACREMLTNTEMVFADQEPAGAIFLN